MCTHIEMCTHITVIWVHILYEYNFLCKIIGKCVLTRCAYTLSTVLHVKFVLIKNLYSHNCYVSAHIYVNTHLHDFYYNIIIYFEIIEHMIFKDV